MKKYFLFIVMLGSCSQPELSRKDLHFNERLGNAIAKQKFASCFILTKNAEGNSQPNDTITIMWFNERGDIVKKVERDSNRILNITYSYDSLDWISSKSYNNSLDSTYLFTYTFNPHDRILETKISGLDSNTVHCKFDGKGNLLEEEEYEYLLTGKGKQFNHQYKNNPNGEPINDLMTMSQCYPAQAVPCEKLLKMEFEIKYYYTASNLDSTVYKQTAKYGVGNNTMRAYLNNGVLMKLIGFGGKRYEYRYSTVPYSGTLTPHSQ